MTVRALMLILALALFTGCVSQTVRPVDIKPKAASFDGNKQDSGLIAVTPTGALVTAHARDRYNALIAVYGQDKEFLPPPGARPGRELRAPGYRRCHGAWPTFRP